MAEPARKKEFDPRSEPSYWEHQVIEGGGEGDGKPTGKLRAIKDDEEPDLKQLEAEGSEDISDETSNKKSGKYDPEDRIRRDGKKSGLKKRGKWKKRLAVGGLLGGLLGGGFVGFILLSGFKIDFVNQFLQRKFFSAAEYAIEQRAQKLLSRYITSHTFRAMSACPGVVVSKDCAGYTFSNTGFSGRLYESWRNARIEERLERDYGIEIRYNTASQEYSIKSPSDQINIPESEADTFDFRNIRQRELVKEVMAALKKDSKWNGVMYRRSVRQMIARKYGAKWCWFACKTRDSIDEYTNTNRAKFKARVVERVVLPLNERYALYFFCIVTECIDPNNRDTFENFLRERNKLAKFATQDIIDEVAKEVADLYDSQDLKPGDSPKILDLIFKSFIEKIVGKVGAKIIIGSIPIVNAVYALDTITNFKELLVDNNLLGNLVLDARQFQYVRYATDLSSHLDEARAGKLNLGEYGAFIQEFEGMEKSLLYQHYLSSSPNKPTLSEESPVMQLVDDVQSGQVNVVDLIEGNVPGVGPADADYQCTYGPFFTGPILKGDLVCPQKKVVDELTITFRELYDAVSSHPVAQALPGAPFTVLNLYENSGPIRFLVHGIFAVFEGILDVLASAILGFLSRIPGVSELVEWAQEWFGSIFQSLFQWIFPPAVTGSETGRESYEAVAAGYDSMGSDFAKGELDPDSGDLTGLGATTMTPAETAAVRNEMMELYEEEFQSKPLFARLFSLDDPSSLVAQATIQGTEVSTRPQDTVANWLANPFRNIASMGSTILASFTPNAFAQASSDERDPFGIIQYGYPVDSTVYDTEPELLTDEYCEEQLELWKEGWEVNPDTGIWEFTNSNPCMLEEVATDVLKSWYTTEDDGGVGVIVSGGGAAGTTSPVSTLTSHPSLGQSLPSGYFQLPPAVNGEYDFWSNTPLDQRCGSRALVDLAYTIATQWGQKYPTDRILVGDLNAPGHLSHTNGVDWDIYTESSIPGSYFNTQAKAIELGHMLADTGIIKNIFYNDPVVEADFNSYVDDNDLSGVMSNEPNHEDHFHVRILDVYRGIDSTGCADTGGITFRGLYRKEEVLA